MFIFNSAYMFCTVIYTVNMFSYTRASHHILSNHFNVYKFCLGIWDYLNISSFVLSVEDVLLFLTHQIDTTTEFKLCVDREDLLDRGIRQWKRKKTASPASVLKVVFIGEAGIDTGALRKEFLTGKLVM